MRNSFIDTLERQAAAIPNLFLLTGDLGFQVMEGFRAKYPQRFFNVGIAEQNMVGIAAGMALWGKLPICYTIATFMTMRTYEQIRNDVCLHDANVKIVGVGGGFGYSQYGPTHHPLEDLAIMRTLPELVVLSPIDPAETAAATKAALAYPGPVYLRLGKKGEPAIYSTEPHFRIGKGTVILEGADAAIISTGAITYEALKAAEELHRKGVETAVVAMPTVKPLDILLLEEIGRQVPYILTVEEGTLIGGFGSAVATYFAERGIHPKGFYRLGTPDRFVKRIGSTEYLRRQFGLDARGIESAVENLMRTKP